MSDTTPEPAAAPRVVTFPDGTTRETSPDPGGTGDVSDFDSAINGPATKMLVVGADAWRCVPSIAARTHAQMMRTLTILSNAARDEREGRNKAKSERKQYRPDPGTSARIADAFIGLIDLCERLVIDEDWPDLDARLESKHNPIGFVDLLQAVTALLTSYSGQPNPKA